MTARKNLIIPKYTFPKTGMLSTEIPDRVPKYSSLKALCSIDPFRPEKRPDFADGLTKLR